MKLRNIKTAGFLFRYHSSALRSFAHEIFLISNPIIGREII